MAGLRRIGPSGKSSCQFGDRLLCVRGYGVPHTVELQSTILIQKRCPYGEQLHQLATVVLVRQSPARDVGFVIVHHVEVIPHGWAERDVGHQSEIISKSIVLQNLQERDHARRLIEYDSGNHEDLAQSEGHSLPQLILPVDCIREEPGLYRTEIGSNHGRIGIGTHGRHELLLEIALQPYLLDVSGSDRISAKSGLIEESVRHSRADRRTTPRSNL